MARAVDLTPPAADLVQALLESGELDRAQAMISALIETDPAQAQEACARALALWPDIMPVHRLFSDLAEQLGNAPEGLELSRRMLLAAHPEDVLLANRMGGALCASGRFAEALVYLRRAAPVLGHHDSALWNYTTALAVTACYHELLGLEPMLNGFAGAGGALFSPFVHLVAARLALRFDRGAVLREIAAREQASTWLDQAGLAERLADAIAGHRPFSVFTLAHAHARLVVYGGLRNHLAWSRAEMSTVVNSVWVEAFGETVETHGAVAAGTVIRDLLAAIGDADVIAMPGHAVLANEHEHFGYLAEMQQAALARGAPWCAGLTVMSDLHEAMPFLRPLLAGQPFLGFVGSSPDLAEKLSRFCQITETASFLVPADLNQAGTDPRGRHYPALLEQTLEALVVPHPGAIFLVAAGLLGPVYCGRIKQRGGIAIDIGGVVARWVRPQPA